MNRFLWVLLGGFFALGLVFLIWGIVQARSTARFLALAERADGEVTRVLLPRGPGRSAADIRFVTADGQAAVFRAGPDSRAYLVGDRLGVLYLPDDPAGARIDSRLDLWFGSGVLFLAGLGFTILSLLAGIRFWRDDRQFAAARDRAPPRPRLPR